MRTLFVMLAACCGPPICLQVLLLSFFEQGLVSLTATAVKLITTTPVSEGYMMSRGMVSLHHTTTSAFVQSHHCALQLMVPRHCLLLSCLAGSCLLDRPLPEPG